MSMEAIRRELIDGLHQAIPSQRPVAIMDVPVHTNPGDLFIYLATLDYLNDRDMPIVFRSSVRDYRRSAARRRISSDTVLISLGGGSFGDLYPRYQALREQVISDFPANTVVVLPQTFFFQSKDNLRRSATIFRKHRDLRLLVRDRPSESLARSEFAERVQLVPDMAHHFWQLEHDPIEPGSGDTLYLLRRDTEARNLPSTIAEHRSEFSDWRSLLPRDYLFRLAITAGLLQAPGTRRFAAPTHDAWARYGRYVLATCVNRMGKNSRVVTDRLHAHLLALLMGRESDIIDNSYGKLSAYFTCWTARVPGARLLDASGTQPGLLEATGTQ